MCGYLCPCVHLCSVVWACVCVRSINASLLLFSWSDTFQKKNEQEEEEEQTDQYKTCTKKTFTRRWVIRVLFETSPHRELLFNKKYSDDLNECVSRQVVHQCVQQWGRERERERRQFILVMAQTDQRSSSTSLHLSLCGFLCVMIANVHDITYGQSDGRCNNVSHVPSDKALQACVTYHSSRET